MKKTFIIFLFCCISLSAAAKIKVTFIFHNKSKLTLDLTLVIKDKNDIQQQILHYGTIAPGQTRQQVEQIPKRYNVTISAAIPNSFNATEEIFTVPTSDVTKETNFTEPDVRSFDQSASAQRIKNSMYQMNAIDYGFAPTTIKSALDSYFGAIVLIQLSSDGKTGQEIYRVSPGLVSDKTSLDNFIFQNTQDEQKVEVNKSLALTATASYPVIGKFYTESTNSDYSLLYWKMQGFGWVPKPEKENWDLTASLNKLPKETKDYLIAEAKKPNRCLIYINQLYAIKSFTYQNSAATAVTSKNDLSVASVLTANGLYNFKRDESKETTLTDEVIDIKGMTFTIQEAQITQPALTQALSSIGIKEGGNARSPLGLNDIAFILKPGDKDNAVKVKPAEKIIIATPYDLSKYSAIYQGDANQNSLPLKIAFKQ